MATKVFKHKTADVRRILVDLRAFVSWGAQNGMSMDTMLMTVAHDLNVILSGDVKALPRSDGYGDKLIVKSVEDANFMLKGDRR